MPDLFQIIDDIDADKQAVVIKRLEDRAQIPKFVAIRESYARPTLNIVKPPVN